MMKPADLNKRLTNLFHKFDNNTAYRDRKALEKEEHQISLNQNFFFPSKIARYKKKRKRKR